MARVNPKASRRAFLKKGPAIAAAAAVAAPSVALAQGTAAEKPTKKVHYASGKKPEKTPLFNSVVWYGNMVFISGIGAHFEGDIKAHTKHVLDEMQKNLERVGSSMEKVLEGQRLPQRPEGLRRDERDVPRALRTRNRACGRRSPPPVAFRATRSSRSTVSRSSNLNADC